MIKIYKTQETLAEEGHGLDRDGEGGLIVEIFVFIMEIMIFSKHVSMQVNC